MSTLAHSDACPTCRRERRARRARIVRAVGPWAAVIAACILVALANAVIEGVVR